uniref:Uncharacterized protein n=1 Tax=viral metagenome TaxID=1070528 RepID=A0A6C0LTV3_9ZZZZ
MDLFSKYVKQKLEVVDQDKNNYYIDSQELELILFKMHDASLKKIKLILSDKQINYDELQSIFINFHKNFNRSSITEIKNSFHGLDKIISINLLVKNETITLNFMADDIHIIASILHATNTFCYMFPDGIYDGLTINICTDLKQRTSLVPINIKKIYDKIDYLVNRLNGFTVSGVTYRYEKIINLTKKEELIKLLFHELIHYIGLDDIFMNSPIKINWSVNKKQLNLSESYTEFIAVLLNTAYTVIIISKGNNLLNMFKNLLNLEIKWSLYLTSNILRFYNYSEKNYLSFFSDDIENNSPIPIWEYVMGRTIFMLHYDEILKKLASNLIITENNKKYLINLITMDTYLIDKLANYISMKSISNISYVIFDIDWQCL